jgi:predicted acylesterase/phospholipase RssA
LNEKTGELKKHKALFRLLLGKKTFGESKNLRKLIDEFVSDEQYRSIVASSGNSMFAVSVVDMKSGKLEIKYSSDIADPNEMKNWIWASANEPLFMSYYNVGDSAFVDGGVRENVPIADALKFAVAYNERHANKIYDIDVVINKPENPLIHTKFEKRGILKGLSRLIDIWSMEVRQNDIDIALLRAQSQVYALVTEKLAADPTYRIHLHYFPCDLFKDIYQKELLFNKERMNKLWIAGEQGQEDNQQKGQPFTEEILTIPASMLTQFLTK